MKDSNNIEQLFRDAFNNHESEVNPDLWNNISGSLHPPVNPAPPSGSTSVFKSAGIFGSKGALLIAGAAIIGAAVYFGTKSSSPEAGISKTALVIHEPAVVKQDLPAASVQQNTVSDERKISEFPSNNVAIHPVREPAKETQNNSVADQSQNAETHSTPTSALLKTTASKDHIAPANKHEDAQVPDEKTTDPQVNPTDVQQTPQFDTIENYIAAVEGGMRKLPNIFTPNGDGLNDLFSITTVNLKQLEVVIFDQSGKQIYSWNSLNGEWDGKLANGNEAPSGNYFYSVNAMTSDGKICIAQSPLKLIR